MKNAKLKRLISYYKPQRGLFSADMLFAILGAAIAVLIPLIVRYITSDVVYFQRDSALRGVAIIVAGLLVMLVVEMFCNFFVAFYGHMMGAAIEFTMRNRLFAHYQKLSFTFYDEQRVGQLMSRVTNDLFDISEMLHHAPEELAISMIKLLGTLGVLLAINWRGRSSPSPRCPL